MVLSAGLAHPRRSVVFSGSALLLYDYLITFPLEV